jgi:hypothetical protein
MTRKFKKKPVIVEAVEYTGVNFKEVKMFCLGAKDRQHLGEIIIPTLEDGHDKAAVHVAEPGDFIIKGVEGEFYPCKPDIFRKTYEEVHENFDNAF